MIRPAVPEDAPAIHALIRSLAGYFAAGDDGPADEFYESISPAAIAANLAAGTHRYHVYEADGALAGMACVRENTHLYHLFVAEDFHRRGIGAALWEHARAEAERAGNPGRFTVNSSLYAVDVYRRFGFRPAGEPQTQNGIAFVPMVLER